MFDEFHSFVFFTERQLMSVELLNTLKFSKPALLSPIYFVDIQITHQYVSIFASFHLDFYSFLSHRNRTQRAHCQASTDVAFYFKRNHFKTGRVSSTCH